MHGAVATKDYNLFNAFFLFAPAVSFAVLFTAFVVVVFPVVFPAILASAVPRGDGWRSFCLSPSIVREFLLVAVGRVLDGDALRGCTGGVVDVTFLVEVVVDEMVRVGVIMDSTEGRRCVALADFEVEGVVGSDFDGTSNSGGRTCVVLRSAVRVNTPSWHELERNRSRTAGVAWTLVISFAREQ